MKNILNQSVRPISILISILMMLLGIYYFFIGLSTVGVPTEITPLGRAIVSVFLILVGLLQLHTKTEIQKLETENKELRSRSYKQHLVHAKM